ncbi:MAG: DinB family protein [Saprospiraceae bacterium]|nr:DinB family protein [Saprospiraceae bacterium]MCF8252632.1 DinB family protein [Saprospiraceae bacterium]MCF8314197.1 DinB family protein [Saprospiraceae bacterium]MCF8442997.1 DinB family protein [Saprospiraceae bacterium]
MTIISLFIRELEAEAIAIRKMLALVPTDKLDWAPHTKSMKMRNLAVHIAELPSWIDMAFNADELDFAAAPYEPTPVENAKGLLAIFEKSMVDGKAQLVEENTSKLGERWVLRHGEMVLWDADRWGVVRMAISQMIHHRAQLGVYLRLLNIPIPGSYGPSADEQNF